MIIWIVILFMSLGLVIFKLEVLNRWKRIGFFDNCVKGLLNFLFYGTIYIVIGLILAAIMCP